MSPQRSSLLGAPAFAAVAALILPAHATAQAVFDSEQYQLRVDTIAEGLVHPWGLALLPDGRYLVTERNPGHLRIGTAEGDLSDPVEGVPEIFRFEGATERSQGGLFDVALHPEFEANGLVYLSLSKPSDHGTGTAIVRGRLVEDDAGGARLEDLEDVFEMKEEDQDSSGLHFGGRMAFHPDDGSLFLSIGERRNISRSQDPHDQAGSIVRVMDDGRMPEDNPFAATEEGDDAIFATGVRNPQGLGFHPETTALWVNDHGPLGGDALRVVEAGTNHGWPYLTAGLDYSGAPLGVGTEKEGMVTAAHYFEDTLAPSGLVFYDGDLFPEWQGDMLNGAMKGEAVVRVSLNGEEVVGEEWMLRDLERRIRDVTVAEDGALWLITEHEDGEVLRVTPADDAEAIGEAPEEARD